MKPTSYAETIIECRVADLSHVTGLLEAWFKVSSSPPRRLKVTQRVAHQTIEFSIEDDRGAQYSYQVAWPEIEQARYLGLIYDRAAKRIVAEILKVWCDGLRDGLLDSGSDPGYPGPDPETSPSI